MSKLILMSYEVEKNSFLRVIEEIKYNHPDISGDYKGGYIYILESFDGVKVGKSQDPFTRIKTIRNSSGKELTRICISNFCSNCYELESALKKRLKDCQIISEWFKTDFKNVKKLLQPMKYKKPFKIDHEETLREMNRLPDAFFEHDKKIITESIMVERYFAKYPSAKKQLKDQGLHLEYCTITKKFVVVDQDGGFGSIELYNCIFASLFQKT